MIYENIQMVCFKFCIYDKIADKNKFQGRGRGCQ